MPAGGEDKVNFLPDQITSLTVQTNTGSLFGKQQAAVALFMWPLLAYL